MPTIKMKDLVEKKKEKKESTELNESLIGGIISVIFGKEIKDIIKKAANNPELKKKINQLRQDAEDIKNFVENDPVLKSIRKK